jgi:hypothetical protein
VPITLAKTGTPPVDVPLVAATFDAASITVSRLDATGWTDVTPAAASITLDVTTSPPAIELVFAQDLTAATAFVLSFQPPPARPTVDASGSPLRPFTRRFRFVLAAGELALDPSI